jgi:NAD(P)H dehydrogenase (quinone)
MVARISAPGERPAFVAESRADRAAIIAAMPVENRPARILVLYHSETGNTREMAQLVARGAEGLPDTEVRLREVTKASGDDLVWCDGVAVGSPTCLGTIAWQMKKFLDDLVPELWPRIEGKIGCAFASSGGLQGGGELTCQAILAALMNFGLLTFGVPDYVAPGRTLHYGAVCAGRPRDDADRAACERLGRRLAEWTQTLVLGRTEHSPRLAAYDRRI